jgi:hypothetical protein
MFGNCKVCAEKDKRVASLEEQIAFLRGLLHPAVDNSNIPESVQEANGILDAQDRPIEIQTYAAATIALSEEELAERDAILSGSY